jgi:hypothetical protein
MTRPADRELLVKTHAASNARDVDATLAAMHPDVDWPNGVKGGRVRGHPAVRSYWTRQCVYVIEDGLIRSMEINE